MHWRAWLPALRLRTPTLKSSDTLRWAALWEPRLCLPRRQEEPDTGWEVHRLLGARWPPKIRRTLKQNTSSKIRLKIRTSQGEAKTRRRCHLKCFHKRWILWCDGLRCLILSQCLQTRPINYSQEVRQPQSLRPPLTWQIICIVRRYQEGLNSTRFKGRSNKTRKSSCVTCPECHVSHRTISKIPNESKMNHPKSLHSMCAEISQDCFCLCPLGIWWFRSTSCSLPSASCQMLQQKVKSHKTCALSACVGVGWGWKFGACICIVCMYEWFVLICDVWWWWCWLHCHKSGPSDVVCRSHKRQAQDLRLENMRLGTYSTRA